MQSLCFRDQSLLSLPSTQAHFLFRTDTQRNEVFFIMSHWARNQMTKDRLSTEQNYVCFFCNSEAVILYHINPGDMRERITTLISRCLPYVDYIVVTQNFSQQKRGKERERVKLPHGPNEFPQNQFIHQIIKVWISQTIDFFCIVNTGATLLLINHWRIATL